MIKGTPLRYGIYLAALDPTIGREIAKTRPVVVVSLDALNRHLETVVVCPLTTSLHPAWRTRLPVTCAGQPAEIAVDQIRTLSTQRLVKKLDTLSPSDAARLRDLLGEMYGST
jgi:mRNA interferase MazF